LQYSQPMPRVQSTPVVDSRRRWLTRRNLCIALGSIWLLDGLLELQPYMWGQAFYGSMLQNAQRALPTGADPLMVFLNEIVIPHTALVNLIVVLVQCAAGIGMFWRRSERLALALSIAWGTCVWIFGEGLGGFNTPGASILTGAPGPAALYVLVAVVLWPRRHEEAAPPGSIPEVAGSGVLGVAGTRAVWVILWLGTAWLWNKPLNHSAPGPGGLLGNAGDNGPRWIAAVNHVIGGIVGNQGTLFAGVMVVAQVLTALLVLGGRTRKAGLLLGVTVAAFAGVFGQDLGGVATGQATDPGTFPVLGLLASSLWPLNRPARTGGISAANDDTGNTSKSDGRTSVRSG
jgi:hypothetical protein